MLHLILSFYSIGEERLQDRMHLLEFTPKVQMRYFWKK